MNGWCLVHQKLEPTTQGQMRIPPCQFPDAEIADPVRVAMSFWTAVVKGNMHLRIETKRIQKGR